MNFVETARTNYIKVNDKQALMDLAHKVGADVSEEEDGRVALLFEDGVPTFILNGEDEGNDISVIDELIPLLPDGEVCVLTSVGYEGLRYVSGYTIAVNNKGEQREINLMDIYRLAKELTNSPDTITRAEY